MKVLVPPVLMLDPSEIFRPDLIKEETNWEFRKYTQDSMDERQQMVFNTYNLMHTNQTVEFVNEKIAKWGQFNHEKMGLLDALDLLNSFVDESDPDIALPNAVHGYQTAERIRAVHPNEDWMHLVGLIHDLGKIMALKGEPQWAVVGDTWPVGCRVGQSVVLRDSTFGDNPDQRDSRYNTRLGMYSEGCGLDALTMSWGHDEYLHMVLSNHKQCTIPQQGLDMIRYHSFYPWHTGGDYQHFVNEKDLEALHWVREFNQFDLYTKKEAIPDIAALRPYYQGLVDKYCPGEVSF